MSLFKQTLSTYYVSKLDSLLEGVFNNWLRCYTKCIYIFIKAI